MQLRAAYVLPGSLEFGVDAEGLKTDRLSAVASESEACGRVKDSGSRDVDIEITC